MLAANEYLTHRDAGPGPSYRLSPDGIFIPMPIGPIGLVTEGIEAARIIGEAGVEAGTVTAEATGAATTASGGAFGLTDAQADRIWRLGWGSRGNEIEQLAGQNLPPFFPVIDSFVDGVATSIKSIDLTAGTYQNDAQLMSRLNRYVDNLAGFAGDKLGDVKVDAEKITDRVLDIIVPRGSITEAQQEVIDKVTARAGNRVKVSVREL